MTVRIADLASQALALPPAERVRLAQQLWESLDDADRHPSEIDEEAIAEAMRRDAELSAGTVQGRSHQEVMDAARKAIE